jgi:hypothetical protein
VRGGKVVLAELREISDDRLRMPRGRGNKKVFSALQLMDGFTMRDFWVGLMNLAHQSHVDLAVSVFSQAPCQPLRPSLSD